MNDSQHTILLVEDDPNDVILFKRAMSRSNLANPLQIVNDGEEAVNYLAGRGDFADRQRYPIPVLIILDLKLPRKSGIEVLEWLHTQELLRRLPVVVLTSSREIIDVDTAYDLGANSYLVKPVAFDDLLQMVRNLGLYWMIMNEMPQLDNG